MIYHVNHFEICDITGKVDVSVTEKTETSIATERGTFRSDKDAFAWIVFGMKHAFYGVYRDYIKSAKNLYEVGHGVHHTIGKDESI